MRRWIEGGWEVGSSIGGWMHGIDGRLVRLAGTVIIFDSGLSVSTRSSLSYFPGQRVLVVPFLHGSGAQ